MLYWPTIKRFIDKIVTSVFAFKLAAHWYALSHVKSLNLMQILYMDSFSFASIRALSASWLRYHGQKLRRFSLLALLIGGPRGVKSMQECLRSWKLVQFAPFFQIPYYHIKAIALAVGTFTYIIASPFPLSTNLDLTARVG